MKRIVLSLILAIAMLIGIRLPTAAAAGPVHTANYGSASATHWTICETHRSWDYSRVTEKDCWHFAVKGSNPSGYWHSRSVSTGGHVITTVSYPYWTPIIPAVSGGCFGAVPAASAQTGVPAAVLRGMIRIESGGDPSAVSGAGAVGCTQLMPDTAAFLRVNPWDAYQNVLGGARYLAQLTAQCGSLYAALACYNGGPGNPQFGYAAAVMARAY